MTDSLDAGNVLQRCNNYHATEIGKLQAALATNPHPSISAGLHAAILEHEQYVVVLGGIIKGMKTAKPTKLSKEEKANG